MRPCVYSMLYGLLVGTLSFANQTGEYFIAQDYLRERGEVYFKFDIYSSTEFRKTNLCNVVSVDCIKYDDVYAYANKDEFENFVQYGYTYEVLTPPGLETEVEMSDTWDDPVKGTRFDFDKYPTYQAYIGQMKSWVTEFPELCHLDTLGFPESKKHVILLMRIESDIDVTNGKPKFLRTSTIHGDEVSNYMHTLRTIDTLLRSYGSDDRITKMVDGIDFYFCPSLNPDATYLGGDNTVKGARRTNIADNYDLNRNYPDKCGNSSHAKWGLYKTSAEETKAIIRLQERYDFAFGCDDHSGTETVLWPHGDVPSRCADEDWHKYFCRTFADQVHEDCNNNGYFTGYCGADGMGHVYSEMYECHGVRLDYQVYYGGGKGTCTETSTRKVLEESQLEVHWGYLREAYFRMYEHLLTGIQGFVTDSQTNYPILNVEISRDGDKEYAKMHTDSLGFYIRLTDKGTFTLTFSHDEYETKVIESFTVDDYEKKYPLDVKLWPKNPTGIATDLDYIKNTFTITAYRKGIRINNNKLNRNANIGIYSMSGKLVSPVLVSNASNIIWDGMDKKGRLVNNGCYIIRIINNNQKLSHSFILHR